jgi:glutamate carboxypeptidase
MIHPMTRRSTPILASILLALGAGVHPAAAGLSPEEAQAAAAVDAGVPRGQDLLVQVVNVNSGTMNFEGVRRVADLLAPEFEALGFKTRWVDGTAWNRAGHLIAERSGSGSGPHVLLIGHLDTVFEADSPFQRYEALSDSIARGPGVSDMKGGDVVMLLALRALEETGALDRFTFTVMLSGDEEKAGTPLELARRDLREAAERADVAIGFEDGDDDPRTAVVARRGAVSWKLRTSGRPSHSSQVWSDEVGSGAVYEAARILNAFHETLRGEPFLTLNPGLILGGTTVDYDPEHNRGSAFGKTNVVAESTWVAGDLRTLSLEQLDDAKSRMQAIVDAHAPRTGAVLTFSDGYPPLAPTEGNRKLLDLFDGASRDLGSGPVTAVDPAKAGAADISFTAGLVEMAMDGVGLMGSGGHTVEETGDLRTLPIQAKRTAVTLLRLAASWPEGRTPRGR